MEESDTRDSSGTEIQESAEAPKSGQPFVYPEYNPVIEAGGPVPGIRFDFNCGFRLQMPEDCPDGVRVVLLDEDSKCVLMDERPKAGSRLASRKRFFVRYRLRIHAPGGELVYDHRMDMRGRQVLVQMPFDGALGDSIAWFSVLERFQRAHGCRLHVVMPPLVADLFRSQYPDIVFETKDSARELRPYATYYLGLYFGGDEDWQPYDFRLVGLAETCARILGLEDVSDIPPRVADTGTASVKEPYVCVATQASGHAKHWCLPGGWRDVAANLRSRGFRVLCIDKDRDVGGDGEVWHSIPNGVEDWTGPRPLQERADLLRHASCFIGLSSGLSWLAWCCGVPVVKITGICEPWGEFRDPYTVQCQHSCHGCWNDTRYEFDHHDFMWCPRHKGTPRAYECTKTITPGMVLDMVNRALGDRGLDLVPAYSGKAFEPSSAQEAVGMSLSTALPGVPPERRWREETEATVRVLVDRWGLREGSRVLDYGCGVGRLSRELCRLGCEVVGVDESAGMRRFAAEYVGSGRFSAVSPEELGGMAESSGRFDFAVAAWVLPHVRRPGECLSAIRGALAPGGELFTLDGADMGRAVPVDGGGFADDHVDAWRICEDLFDRSEPYPMRGSDGIPGRLYRASFHAVSEEGAEWR